MIKLIQNLYITYSNQRARDLKANASLNPFDKVITLEQLILETFEQNNFQIIIDDAIASSIVYKLIQDHNIEYFSYLESDADSLNTIYNFIVKCHRNDVSFGDVLCDEKLIVLEEIDQLYQSYKKSHSLVDVADIENEVLSSWDDGLFIKYNDIFVDNFSVEEISFVKSEKQKKILEQLARYKKIEKVTNTIQDSKMIKPKDAVFDNIDEVKTALKIARKLLEEGVFVQMKC